MKKILVNRHFLPLLIVLFFGILAARSLIFEPGYFNMHDDLQMMRQLELEKCIEDGQIPCRWVPDMGYGYGFPLFNFYPPMPYMIGQIFRAVGFSFVVTAKLSFALSIILSGIAMYLLSKDFFGRVGGILSAVFYIWAPYHSVDIYVRGALNEAWALVFFPLIFWTSYRLIRAQRSDTVKWILGLSASYTGLLLSHNLMVIIFSPFFAIWVLIHLWSRREWRKLPALLASGILAFGLSAFFTLPAVAESGYTQIKGQLAGYYNYSVHFVTLKQLLISRFWGYGPSVWLEEDRMSFQIGHLHWILSLVVGIILLFRVRKDWKNGYLSRDYLLLTTYYLLLMGWFAAFMTHARSTPLYLALEQLQYVQFPWRFLTIVIFAFSFTVGFLPATIRWKSGFWDKLLMPFRVYFSALLILLLLVLGWNYFKPEYGRMGPLTDEQKFEGRAWMLQQTAGIYDYLPVYAQEAPKEGRNVLAEVVGGEGLASDFQEGTYWGKFSLNVNSETATIRINIFKFPGWKVFVDGREVNTFIPPSEKWGRMWVDVPSGNHTVYTQLFNTPVRTFSNIISLISIAVFSVFFIKRRQITLFA